MCICMVQHGYIQGTTCVFLQGTTCVYTGYRMFIYRVPHAYIQCNICVYTRLPHASIHGPTCVYKRYRMGMQCTIWITSRIVDIMVFL